MTTLTNMKISKKLALASGISVSLLACVGGLALWALNESNAAAVKADHYANKRYLSQKVDANISELALLMANLPTSKQSAQMVERVLGVRKEYAADFQYLKDAATNDEDRGMLRRIEDVIVPWRNGNNQII